MKKRPPQLHINSENKLVIHTQHRNSQNYRKASIARPEIIIQIPSIWTRTIYSILGVLFLYWPDQEEILLVEADIPCSKTKNKWSKIPLVNKYVLLVWIDFCVVLCNTYLYLWSHPSCIVLSCCERYTSNSVSSFASIFQYSCLVILLVRMYLFIVSFSVEILDGTFWHQVMKTKKS